MSGYALLSQGKSGTPRIVQLSVADDKLLLTGGDGFAEPIDWWRLYRKGAGGSIDTFRRLDRPDWELRVSAGADQALLAHVKQRSLARFLGPLHRLHLAKALAAAVTAIFAVSSAVPASWIAERFTPAAEARLVDGYVASRARDRCTQPEGTAALRKLLTRLDPELGRSIEIVAVNEHRLTATSFPARKLYLTRESVVALEADALAALLAHEIAHMRRGDPLVAAVRHEGSLGIFLALLNGPDRTDLYLTFSGQEEERADREAIAMMRRARLPIAPAAALFEEMRIAAAQGSGFAADQRDFHFGIADRARVWKQAAQRDAAGAQPALTLAEGDALFNLCWPGPMPQAPAGQRNATPRSPDPSGR